MTLAEYQKFTKTTNHCSERWQNIHLISGLQAEVGEVSELIQKFYRDKMSNPHLSDKELSIERDMLRFALTDEIGDVIWYISELASHYEISLDHILRCNISKLKERHGV